MRVLLTGATGFIGSAILPALCTSGHRVVLAGRGNPAIPGLAFRSADFDTLDIPAATALLDGVDAVIHAAGYAHATGDSDPARHQRINRDATILLAKAAANAGARFIYLSSIKALGPPINGTLPEEANQAPSDAYGASKFEAEATIRHILPQAHVILRPALVVGAGARGNLARFAMLARLPLPLPFARVAARRSLISREDVVALALRALGDDAMAGQSFTLADPDALTPGEIIAALRAGLRRKPELFPTPPTLMDTALRVLGRREEAERLFSPSVARPSALLAFGWQPLLPARQALAAMTATRKTG